MTAVREWAVGLCLAAIGLLIVTMLMPEGRLKKTLTTLAGVCFFCCLIEPVGGWCRQTALWFGGAFEEAAVSQELTVLTEEQIDRVIEEALCADATHRLQAYNAVADRAQIERDTSSVDGIYIKRVVLTVTGETLPRDAYTMLELAWGVEVEVIEEDG